MERPQLHYSKRKLLRDAMHDRAAHASWYADDMVLTIVRAIGRENGEPAVNAVAVGLVR